MAASQEQQPRVIVDLSLNDSEDDELGYIANGTPGQQVQQIQRPQMPVPASPPGAPPVIPDLQPFALDDWIDYADHAIPAALPLAEAVGNFEDMPIPQAQQRRGEIIFIDGEEVFIPDEDPEPEQPVSTQPRLDQDLIDADGEASAALETENFTADTCLQRVLAIFPDISHEHVLTLYKGFDAVEDRQILPGRARFENIVDKLASDANYPKQEKDKRKKRKREDGDDGDDKRWEGPDREVRPPACRGPMSAMLKADFPEIPCAQITHELSIHNHFYQTYVALANAKDSSDGSKRWRGRPPSKNFADAAIIATNCGFPTLIDELNAARKKVEGIRTQRTLDEAKKRAEHENLQRAIAAGETAECQACFEDLPTNRQVYCDGDVPHFTCLDCITTYIKSEVGESRCRVLCTAGCGAGFAHAQLHCLEDERLLEKLEHLQQEKDIRDAHIDDLEECPFCDYKVILPPVEVDFEFRCGNPECERVSCRRCKAPTHTPLSCEEYAKDNQLNSRHKIEEAMTAALVRSCNKCKKQFIKEFGCNKMTCPSCGNLQCYVCSSSLANYNHFDQAPGGMARSTKCPLYDNVEERHEREVKEAEAAARAQILKENPNVTEEDLEIKVSDAVTKATQDRLGRGNLPGGHLAVAVPMPYGGLHPGRHQPGGHLGVHGADNDEGDEGNHDFNIPAQLQRQEQMRHALIARLAMENRLAFRERLRGHPVPANHNVQRQHPFPPNPQPQPGRVPPVNGPVAMHGYIPVYGFQPGPPPAGQYPGAHPQPQAQAQAQAQQQLLPPPLPPANDGAPGRVPRQQAVDLDVIDAFLEDFGGAHEDPFALPPAEHAVQNPAVPHPVDPPSTFPDHHHMNDQQLQQFQPQHAQLQETPVQAQLRQAQQRETLLREVQRQQAQLQQVQQQAARLLNAGQDARLRQIQLQQNRLQREHQQRVRLHQMRTQALLLQRQAEQNAHNQAGPLGDQELAAQYGRRQHQGEGFPGASHNG